MKQDLTNQFFDINRFPKGWGNIVFPISISRIEKDQNAQKTFEFLKHFYPSKKNENKMGITLLYSDGLYQWKPPEERISRRQSLEFLSNHSNGYKKILRKNEVLFQIQSAFSFLPWNTVLLMVNDFMDKYDRTYKSIKEDELFESYLKEDCDHWGREFSEEQKSFFVEEIIIFYLLTKMKVELNNAFTLNREKWLLIAYPGKPLKSQIYFYQKNMFGLNNTGNEYENCFYDLESKKLYDFDRLDLETWNYE